MRLVSNPPPPFLSLLQRPFKVPRSDPLFNTRPHRWPRRWPRLRCERTKWKEWDAKGTKNKIELSSHLVDKRPGPADRAIAARTCPQLTAYYAAKYPKL